MAVSDHDTLCSPRSSTHPYSQYAVSRIRAANSKETISNNSNIVYSMSNYCDILADHQYTESATYQLVSQESILVSILCESIILSTNRVLFPLSPVHHLSVGNVFQGFIPRIIQTNGDHIKKSGDHHSHCPILFYIIRRWKITM